MSTKDGLQLKPFHVKLYFPKNSTCCFHVSMESRIQFFNSKINSKWKWWYETHFHWDHYTSIYILNLGACDPMLITQDFFIQLISVFPNIWIHSLHIYCEKETLSILPLDINLRNELKYHVWSSYYVTQFEIKFVCLVHLMKQRRNQCWYCSSNSKHDTRKQWSLT
jgi:hypothetical protein